MDGLLGSVYSFGDRLKKRARGLINDPVHQMQVNANAWAGDTLQAMQSPEGMAAGLLGMAPAGLAGTFAGVKAKTADVAKLAKAEAMEKAGAPREEIWSATGWFKGPDKKWRFEISDHAADLVRDPDGYRNTIGNLSEVLKHDDLYAAYPQLKKIPTDASAWTENILGSYGKDIGDLKPSIKVTAPNNEGVVSGLLHEAGGHGVQNIEGFARGGSNLDRFPMHVYRESVPDALKQQFDSLVSSGDEFRASLLSNAKGMELYKRLAGEAEARTVQARRHMRPEQRIATPPWESYDIPWEKLIIQGLLR